MKRGLLRSTLATLAVVTMFVGCQSPSTQSVTPDTKASTTPAPATQAKVVEVTIENFKFSPQNLEVAVGDTVKWTNKDSAPHTATSSAGTPEKFDTGNLTQGQSGSFTFKTAGDYNYICNIHPTMTGSVKVK